MMRKVAGLAACLAVAGLSMPAAGLAQSASNLAAERLLLPFSALPRSAAGEAALAANFQTTGAIQTGSLPQPAAQPFAARQHQALLDGFITGLNAAQLADGLGTSLGAAYRARANYTALKTYTSISPAVEKLIAYTVQISGADSNAAKYFFANATTDGHAPVSAEAAALLTRAGGTTDVLGKAYGRAAGSPGADPFGNSRPFQTEPRIAPIAGSDYLGKPATNAAYLSGPAQDLRKSPSFPSGHTTYGYTGALILGILVPQRYGQEIVRAAEYGNSRILLGAHYAMDVIGGRALALYDMAHLLAGDPRYVGQATRSGATISDYPAALRAARADLTAALQAGCGHPVAVCAASDTGRFNRRDADAAFYGATQTYGLPVVYPRIAATVEDVGKLAPEAGMLLTAAFPYLSLAEADRILTATEGPGGGFLDDGSAAGLYARLNLYAAIQQAAAAAPAR